MRIAVVARVAALAFALVACGHKKPKEAKNAPAPAAAAEPTKCEVKGFAFSVPAPGPITDGGAP